MLLAGCGRALPPPELSSVLPERIWNGIDTPIRIRGEGLYLGFLGPLEGRGSVSADVRFEVALLLGDDRVPLEAVTWESQGSLLALVPAGIPAAFWNLSLVRPDGQEALLPAALQVVDALPPDVVDVSPSLLPSDGTTELRVLGTALDPDATVLLGTEVLTVLGSAGDLLVTEVPAGLDADYYALTVLNPDGQSGAWDDLVQVVDRTTLPAMMTVTAADLSWGDTANVMLSVSNPSTSAADLDVTFSVEGAVSVVAESPRDPIPAGGETTWWWLLEAISEGPTLVSVRGEGPLHRLLPHTELIHVRRLFLQLTAPMVVTAGTPVQVTLLVVNFGPAPVADVTPSLVVTVPAGPSVSPSDPTPASSDLAPYASVAFVYEVTFDPAGVGVTTLTAQVAGLVAGGTSASAVVSTEVTVP